MPNLQVSYHFVAEKNTTDALSLSSVKFFCALQAVLCLLISLSFIIAAMIVCHISNYVSPLCDDQIYNIASSCKNNNLGGDAELERLW